LLGGRTDTPRPREAVSVAQDLNNSQEAEQMKIQNVEKQIEKKQKKTCYFSVPRIPPVPD
jgi:hypothetical protein